MIHMNSSDFDFIKNRFDSDGIAAPDTIDEIRAMELISDKKPSKIKFYKKNAFKSLVSLAACAAIVISCISAVNSNNTVNPDSRNAVSVQGSISYFDSYNELKSAIKKAEDYVYPQLTFFDALADAVAVNENKNTEIIPQGSTGGSSFGKTYTQVDGVEEADYVKNDGKYIYVAAASDSSIKIYDGNGDKPKLVAKIDDFRDRSYDEDYDNNASDNVYEPVQEMYLKDGKLIVNTTTYESRRVRGFDTAVDTVHSYVYDVSDLSNIKRISHFKQSGFYTDSRLIDDTMYIISTKCTYSCKYIDEFVPYAYAVSGREKKEYVSADKICCPADPNTSSMLVLSAVDINTGEKVSDTKAVFGCDGTVYCNKDNLYIAVGLYDNDESKLNVIKASLKDEISFTDSAVIDGCINDQFSMDEYNGYFRIATTTEKYIEKKGEYARSNNLFILDSKLKKVGKVTGFAKNEIIEAVKFMGDIAYVITYENTDPLFVIDLKDAKNPQILGSVKIDGFSSQLLPIGDDRVLGIGYHTQEDTWETGIKLVLFDVSDKSKPKVLDSYVMKEASSQAQGDHKAILINNKDGYYAIDFDTSDYDYNNIKMGALTFEVNDDKINVTNVFDYFNKIKDRDDIYSYSPLRTTFIDDTVYSIDWCGNIYAFNYKN